MSPLWAPIVITGVAVVSALLDDWGARRSLRAWATREGVELLDARRAPPWQAPFAYMWRSREISWRVTIRQHHMKIRTGMVTFLFVFLGGFRPRFVEARWDTSPGED
jgi:hypothetical protein